jgi:hypothetical protein
MIQFQPRTKTAFDTLISWVESEEVLLQFSGPLFKFLLTKEQPALNISDQNRHTYAITESLTGKMIAYAEIFITLENIALLDRIIIGDPKMRWQGIGLQIVQQLLMFRSLLLIYKLFSRHLTLWLCLYQSDFLQSAYNEATKLK